MELDTLLSWLENYAIEIGENLLDINFKNWYDLGMYNGANDARKEVSRKLLEVVDGIRLESEKEKNINGL